jgi:hypothetical protein
LFATYHLLSLRPAAAIVVVADVVVAAVAAVAVFVLHA